MVDATLDSILDADDLQLVKVSVPYWKNKDGQDLDIYIKQMSGEDADEYVKAIASEQDGIKKNIKSIITCVCNADGSRMFKKEHIHVLMRKNAQAINWVVNKVLEVNFKNPEQVNALAKK